MPKEKYNVEQELGKRAKRIAKIRKADVAARKKKKSAWVSRLKERVKRELKGRHSPAGKKYKTVKQSKTTRTKTITAGLKTAGITEKEIAKLRRKR